MQSEETLMKLLTIGPPGVGKTSLILRLTQDNFNENSQVTLAVDFGIKKIHINNQLIKLQLWDTAGQERYRTAISRFYFRATHGIFFIFDITNEQSFQEIQTYYKRTKEEMKKFNENCSYILIGCKGDLQNQRAISYEVAMALGKNLGMRYIETSAKLNINCFEAVDYLARLCFDQIINKNAEENFKLQDDQKKTICC